MGCNALWARCHGRVAQSIRRRCVKSGTQRSCSDAQPASKSRLLLIVLAIRPGPCYRRGKSLSTRQSLVMHGFSIQRGRLCPLSSYFLESCQTVNGTIQTEIIYFVRLIQPEMTIAMHARSSATRGARSTPWRPGGDHAGQHLTDAAINCVPPSTRSCAYTLHEKTDFRDANRFGRLRRAYAAGFGHRRSSPPWVRAVLPARPGQERQLLAAADTGVGMRVA